VAVSAVYEDQSDHQAEKKQAEIGEAGELREHGQSSGFALDLGPPPADTDEQETPILEEFRGLAFEGMSDELEDPSKYEQSERIGPQGMEEDAAEKK